MWALVSDSRVELLRLSATTIAEGKGTRIHYDVLPPESSVRDQVAKGLKENGAYRDLYRSALAEQIDAKLTNREFAIQNIAVAAARVTLGALPNIRESMDNAEKEYQRRQQQDIDRVYANEK
jgi:non-homologous end joining protein Ku